MSDIQGLYVVAAVVLAALLGWVLLVLVRAPDAPDDTIRPATEPSPRAEEGAPDAAPLPEPAPPPAALPEGGPVEAPPPPPPAPQKPPAPPVDPPRVDLPQSRRRLSSHQEIQDDSADAPVLLMPGEAPAPPKDVKED
jgi:hypothetical protein